MYGLLLFLLYDNIDDAYICLKDTLKGQDEGMIS